MPFLYSTLRFERDVNGGPASIKYLLRKRRQTISRAMIKRQKKLKIAHKNPDLLFSLFKHRVRRRNEKIVNKREAIRQPERDSRKVNDKTHLEGKLDFDTQTASVDVNNRRGTWLQKGEESTSSIWLSEEATTSRFPKRLKKIPTSKVSPEKSAVKTDDTERAERPIKPKTVMVFNFIYFDRHSGLPSMQSDSNGIRGFRRCPLCFFRGVRCSVMNASSVIGMANVYSLVFRTQMKGF